MIPSAQEATAATLHNIFNNIRLKIETREELANTPLKLISAMPLIVMQMKY